MIDKLVFDNNFLPTTAVVHKINEIIDHINGDNRHGLCEKDGQLWYNGSPLYSYGYAEVYKLCVELYHELKEKV